VAVVDALGALETATGNASDCMHVDGSSGACGSTEPSFVDADTLTGIVDGSNTSFSLSAAPSPASSLALYRNGMLEKAGVDYTANVAAIQFLSASTPQPGDALLASYRLAGGAGGGAAQPFPSPQVLCSGAGAATNGISLASIGTCQIAGGVLAVGDRIAIHFDLAHQGTAGGFTFEILWGATTVVQRVAAAGDALVGGRAEAAIENGGAQLSQQSWGTVLPLAAGVAQSTDAYASGLTIGFQGEVAQAVDTLTLSGYSVVRLP
jgi:hypothetical protein